VTTLAAIQGEGWCAIGSDSRASDESGFIMQIVTGKSFVNGPALIAGAGAVRGINLLQFGWTAPAYGKSKSTDHYMTRVFIPAMRKCFIEAGYDMKDDGEVALNDNDFLVAVKGVLYSVAEDYSWERCRQGLYVAGSGGKLALGALEVQGASKAKTVEQAEKMLRKAVEAAIKYDCYSGGDILVMSQES
jgi:ATP-dependent protease HslVU (ClpYQ) peptidase subunit